MKAESRQHLVVGLGNPGQVYASTRHNIGFMAADRLIREHGLTACRSRVNAEVAEGDIAGVPVMIAKPLAFMNRSGGPVRSIIQIYGIKCEDMVVIHDDIDLAYERLKIKEKGGDGGHNGLRSLIDALGTDDFVRVRMGVGRPEGGIGVVDYVLEEFDANQRITLGPFLSRAIEAAATILCEGAKEAMNRFNRKP
ncbi:aminoacyl-tRNA hydrolase [uncultured Desulfosarcina sp.]|uniref:aminoacyl-tRNA hydrolase n=1 Tax=uncultured Desulfosarcina sp. TaxID=218289 RepID=UPI0029C845E7|nr:aminoacyl-tRNA hydrolase [uncultured Desulfosarcina sp.]